MVSIEHPLKGPGSPPEISDATQEYKVGDIWYAADSNTEFICTDVTNGKVEWEATISPATKMANKIVTFLKLYLSSFSCRKLPYMIVGLLPDRLIYTNVKPTEFKRFVRVSPDQAYHFVHLKDRIFLDKLYELYPELMGRPCAINCTLLSKLIAATEPIEWIKTAENWSVEVKKNISEAKDPTVEETAEEAEEAARPAKVTPVIWFSDVVHLDPLVAIHEQLQKVMVSNPNRIDVNINTLIKSEVNYISIAEKPLDTLCLLKYYIRYPLVEGYNTVSIAEFHKKLQPRNSTMCIATWEDNQVLRTTIVYETEAMTVWSYAPGVVWFPNKRIQIGDQHGQ